MVEAFAGVYLSPRYDSAQPTPEFHRETWDRYCSDVPAAATAAPRNHAKAQPLTSKVLTPTGWCELGDLEIGDDVVGRDGLCKKVTHLHPISVMEMWEVRTRDGRKTLCNGEHLWPSVIPSNTGSREVVKELLELKSIYIGKREGERRCFIPTPKAFEGVDLSVSYFDPYMLGVWLGDGTSSSGTITSADPEIFDYFVDGNTVIKRNPKYLYRVENLTTTLRKFGLLNNKHIPDVLLRTIKVDRLALLQGLMDTDGTVHNDGRTAYFCNTNSLLIDGVVDLVRGLGGIAVVCYGENSYERGGEKFPYWRVSVKLDGMCPFRLKRKANKWIGGSKNGRSGVQRVAIESIEPAGLHLGRCITVEDNYYITDDYLLTHNSTAFTHDYGLAMALFRVEQYIMIVSASEEMAIEHLNDIANELRGNDDLIRDFKIKGFITDQKTDIIIECIDGYQFRFLARGAEQKIRGRKWHGKRPGLIIGDDMEDDEQVESKDRRSKFRRWFFRACVQALRDGGKIRVHGTILNDDSLLMHLMKNSEWASHLYKAHKSFSEFTEILWPEKFPVERLRYIRQGFINEGDAPGYSQEYLNSPRDNDEAYLRRDDFIPMSDDDYQTSKIVSVGVDFAVSKMDTANRTSFSIAGKDINNVLHFIDQRKGRWDISEIIEEFFAVNTAWSPDMFYVEAGVIWLAIQPILEREMQTRDQWLPITAIQPIKDKKTRGRSMQKRMRARGCRFDSKAEWYADFEDELLKFTGNAEALLDDQFDSAAILSKGLEDHRADLDEEDFETDDERDWRGRSMALKGGGDGRSQTTGY